MKLILFVLVFIGFSLPVQSDDAEHNIAAKMLKKKVERYIDKRQLVQFGYCDITFQMEHKQNKAVVKRIQTRGSTQLCKLSKKAVKIGQKVKYEEPEKFIRIHISTNN
ncbi:hypothetical protein [Vibrio paucivorans]